MLTNDELRTLRLRRQRLTALEARRAAELKIVHTAKPDTAKPEMETPDEPKAKKAAKKEVKPQTFKEDTQVD